MLLFIIALFSFACGRASWSQFGHDPARTSTAGDLSKFTADNAKVSFRVTPPYKGSFFGTPMLDGANNRLIQPGSDGYLYALDASNGTTLWRSCIGKKGLFPSNPCKGFAFPSGIDNPVNTNMYFMPAILPDGSFIVVLPLADQPGQPPYGYSDHRDVIIRVNGTTGLQIWNVTSGLFVPGNGDCSTITRPIVVPNGDILFWQKTNGESHLVRMDWVTGKILFNLTSDASGKLNFSYTGEITYVADDDSIWTNAIQEAGIVKLSATSGKLLFHLESNLLDSFDFPHPPVYDARTKLLHFGRVGQSIVYAINALDGTPVWQVNAWEAGWPSSVTLCPSNSVLWFSDHAGLALWNEAAAEAQQAVWSLPMDDPPPPARVVPSSLDGRFIVAYGNNLYVLDCATGKTVFQSDFDTSGDRASVQTGPIIGNNEIFVNFGGELLKIITK